MENKFNNYVSNIQNEMIVWPTNFSEQSLNYKSVLPKDKKAKIVEFGPGRGYFTDWLICNGYENIILVELDDENCSFLRKKYNNLETIQVFKNDMFSFLRDSTSEYDLIISKMVLEHVPVDLISGVFHYGELRLSKGGVMVHETINATNFIYGLYYRFNDFSHTISYTTKSLREFAGQELMIRSHKKIGIINVIKCRLHKREEKLIEELSKKLILERNNNFEIPGSYQGDFAKLFRSFFFHIVTSLRFKIAIILTYLFYKDLTEVYSHFLIVELHKNK